MFSAKEHLIIVPSSRKPLCLQMVTRTISIHPILLWPGDILPATPTGPQQVITDHQSRLFLSLINCYGLASRLSVVLSVFCSLARVTRFTRSDWHFAKASGVPLNELVFLPEASYIFWHLYYPTLFPRANYWNPSPPWVQVELRLVAVLQEELGNVIACTSDCSLNFLMQWSLLLCCEAVMQKQSAEYTSTGSEIKTPP